ncbi:TPA: hypothetical protein HA316_00950 [Candidatus Micrarchaeota archaeon]|nr:hypothetical protein [Candidatus Micrarchaeota archaeon]
MPEDNQFACKCISAEETPNFAKALCLKFAGTLEKILVTLLAVVLVASVAVALR